MELHHGETSDAESKQDKIPCHKQGVMQAHSPFLEIVVENLLGCLFIALSGKFLLALEQVRCYLKHKTQDGKDALEGKILVSNSADTSCAAFQLSSCCKQL